jgi:hypothetical protein
MTEVRVLLERPEVAFIMCRSVTFGKETFDGEIRFDVDSAEPESVVFSAAEVFDSDSTSSIARLANVN